ncbi:IS110 family transposase, partial [Paraburkholderia sp. RL17-373-BIF-A]|uniref:IS110 family transposase n=1 Tax=Paraburkholderia sp. RL17-373-BIF-A TaxID=3031629 RepID=UPI0038BC50E1
GREADLNDAMWIAGPARSRAIRSSFVPLAAIQELRDLTCTRKQLTREITRHCLRIRKVLEDANLKLGSVLADVLGGSGARDPEGHYLGRGRSGAAAALVQGHARRKPGELREALRGRVTSHHREMLALHSQFTDALERALTDLDAAVGLALTPIHQHVQLLRTIPGVGDLTAQALVAEIGST